MELRLKSGLLVEAEIREIFLVTGTLCHDWHDSLDGCSVYVKEKIVLSPIEGLTKSLDMQPYDTGISIYDLYQREIYVEEYHKSRYRSYRNGADYKTERVLILNKDSYTTSLKRIRQVRDALNKCKDSERIEKCAEIFGI